MAETVDGTASSGLRNEASNQDEAQTRSTVWDGFGRIMFAWQDQLALDGALPPIALRVGTAIRRCVNKKNQTAWPSQAWIAKSLRQWKSPEGEPTPSELRAVRRGVAALVARGHLIVLPGTGRRSGNRYRPMLLDGFSWPVSRTVEAPLRETPDEMLRTVAAGEHSETGQPRPSHETSKSSLSDTDVLQNHSNYSSTESVTATTAEVSSRSDRASKLLLTRAAKTLATEEEEKLAYQLKLLRSMLDGQMSSDKWKASIRSQLLKLRSMDLNFEMDLVPAVQEAICDGKIRDDVGGISWFGARAKIFMKERIELGDSVAMIRVRALQACYDRLLLSARIGRIPDQDSANSRPDNDISAGNPLNSQVAVIFEILHLKSPSQDQWRWFTQGLSELLSRGWDFERELVPLVADAVAHGEVPDTIQSVRWFVKTRERRMKKRVGRLPGI